MNELVKNNLFNEGGENHNGTERVASTNRQGAFPCVVIPYIHLYSHKNHHIKNHPHAKETLKGYPLYK